LNGEEKRERRMAPIAALAERLVPDVYLPDFSAFFA
jgi:hypothetical protein